MERRKPTREELRQAALILGAAAPADRKGIGGRPKKLEKCPLRGCDFKAGYNELVGHIANCPHNHGKLTVARWREQRRRARAKSEDLLKAS